MKKGAISAFFHVFEKLSLLSTLYSIISINKNEAPASFLLMMNPTLSVHVAMSDFFWCSFSDF